MGVFIVSLIVLTAGPADEAARRVALQSQTSSVVPADLTDAEVAERVRGMLGAIDTRVTEAQWRALGPRAEAHLAKLAEDEAEFPTRRAKAVEGLVVVGGPNTSARLTRLAEGEKQPLVVRLAALRGFKSALDASARSAALGRLLQGAVDARIRAAAAESLAVDATGCQSVRSQLGREGPEARALFHRSVSTCGIAPVDLR